MNADAPQGCCSNLPQHCELARNGEPQDISTSGAGCRNCGMALMPLSRRQGEEDAAVGRTLAKRAAVFLVLLAAIVGGLKLLKQPPAPAVTAEQAAPAPEARRDALDHYLLRLSGSSTLGQKLAPDLAAAWLASKGATHIEAVERRDDQGASLPERVVSGEIDDNLVGVEIKGHGTASGFEALRAGDADIWIASAPASAEQLKELEGSGGLTEHVLGLDGIAIVVSPSNPLKSLTKAQLKSIFSGAIKDWKELKLPPGPINLYARGEGSGTRASFEAMALGPDVKMAPLAAAKPEGYADNDELAHDVAHDPHGIGFVSMAQVAPAKAVEIKDGPAAAALAPTVFTVRTESYPLSRRLYLNASGQPSEDASAFIDFALGEAGQAIVEKSLVGLLPTRQAARDADTRPCELSKKYPGNKQEFCELRARALVIDSSFRFKNGSFDLDALAAKNLDRVIETLKPASESRVVVAGFADSRGDYAANCKLALKRAETVKEALVAGGLANVEARGFCPELPVRDNAGADYEQNRRVEVYELEGKSAPVR
ncbi:MAG TPA: phosphate ABC transporter substrate-binding/OmpA family protein [Methylocystis sp.]|nr:phosphate ABC transporter substrate-binding/OmpA family protein [Methylocystis sp.]